MKLCRFLYVKHCIKILNIKRMKNLILVLSAAILLTGCSINKCGIVEKRGLTEENTFHPDYLYAIDSVYMEDAFTGEVEVVFDTVKIKVTEHYKRNKYAGLKLTVVRD